MELPLNWDDEDMAAGLRCYRAGEFFEAHEHWEAVWMRTEQPTKLLVQALIQITVAFHHLSNGNTAGALSLLGRALSKLEKFPGESRGMDIGSLRRGVQMSQERIVAGENPATIPAPHIGPITE